MKNRKLDKDVKKIRYDFVKEHLNYVSILADERPELLYHFLLERNDSIFSEVYNEICKYGEQLEMIPMEFHNVDQYYEMRNVFNMVVCYINLFCNRGIISEQEMNDYKKEMREYYCMIDIPANKYLYKLPKDQVCSILSLSNEQAKAKVKQKIKQ